MILVPLGVASATPTATRHLSSLAVWREGTVLLFDCGEGAQMRMLQAGIKRSKIKYIFISHFDYDHFTGLVGLLSTLQLQRREVPLTIIAPKGIKEFVEWNFNFINVELTYPINFIELEEGFDSQVVVDEADFFVEARPLKHGRFCVGYRMQERDKPGKVDGGRAADLGITEDHQFKALKNGEDVTLDDGTVITSEEIVGPPIKGDSMAYITDTLYCENSVELAKDVTVLYHEATFSEALADKAEENFHSTAKTAARVAIEANVEHLVITHFSARYTNPFVLLREAKEDFENTWMATELRPIMTNREVESGIIQSRVVVKEISELEKEVYEKAYEVAKQQRGRGGRGGGGGGYRGGGGGGDRRKSFRSRHDDGGGRDYDRGGRSGGGGGYDRGGRSGGGGYDRGGRSGGGGYDRGGRSGGGGYDRGGRSGGGGYDRGGRSGGGGYDRGGRSGGGGYDRGGRSGGGGYDRGGRSGGGGGYDRGGRSGGGGYDRGGRSGGGGYDRGGRSGGGGGYDRGGRSGGGGYDRGTGGYDRGGFDRGSNYPSRDTGRPSYDKRGGDDDNKSPRPITPRTPFDDFNRF